MARTVLTGGSVFDGTGAAPFNADIAIEDGRIVEIGADLTGDEVIDVTGKLVIPGLMDVHTHATSSGSDVLKARAQPFSMQFFEAADNLKKMLESGVTTARDAGGIDLGVKTAVQQGMIPGPRLQIAISVLSQTGGHGDGWGVRGSVDDFMIAHPGRPASVVDGTDEMRKRVREVLRAGADVIKLCTSGGVLSPGDDPRHPHFNIDEIRVAVEEAEAAGAHVLAHAQGAQGIKNALRAGVRSIEHGIYLDDECIELFHETGAWLVPTLLAPAALNEMIEAGNARMPQDVIDKAIAVYSTHTEAIRKAHAAGVKIALGTDAGVFEHGIAWRELGLLVGIGMTPQEAIISATKNAAELLRIEDEVGTLESGKAADIVVLGGDDAWDLVRFADNLQMVIQSGNVVVDHR